MSQMKMFVAACGAAVVLSACSSGKDEAGAKTAVPGAAVPAVSALPNAALLRADPAVPLEQYQERTLERMTFLRHALAVPPVDYEKVAWTMSAEYRATSDAFKKKDLLEALKPQIDAKLAEVRKSGRYLYVNFKPGTVSLGHYTLETKSFPIRGLDAASLFVTNGGDFKALPMPDEARAREVEAIVAKGVEYNISSSEKELAVPGSFPTVSRMYVFAQGIRPDGGPIQFQIVKLVMKTTDGLLFAER